MNKYKVRSTTYLVFLLVSLLVIFLLGYMLIFENKDNTCPSKKSIDKQEIINIYDSVFKFINEEKLLGKPLEEELCLNIDFDMFHNYFTERCIKDMQSFLIYENESYYDCNNNLKNNIYNSILGNKKKNIKVLMHDNNKVLVGEDDLSSYMLLVKVNDKWLIDSYE